jgi:catechol 2,3-dioxygenase-like lactoylglutathione lyase family enzyme
MNIRRVVPDIRSARIEQSREFYVDFLGFHIGMDLDWVMTFVSPSNPTAQITLVRDDDPGSVQPQLSIEVDDVDEAHANAVDLGLQILYPLRDEPWGVRRFFVADPNGVVINILSHAPRPLSR